jgi:hypothetical protein
MRGLCSVAIALLTIVGSVEVVRAHAPGQAPGVDKKNPPSAQGQAQHLSPDDLKALTDKIRMCWAPPAKTGSEKLVVKVRLSLNRDGSIRGHPVIENRSDDPNFETVAASVLRALDRRQPFPLSAGKYAAWKELALTFDPTDFPELSPHSGPPAHYDVEKIKKLLDRRNQPTESK